MKKLKSKILSLMLLGATLLASCQQEEVAPLRRADDSVSLAYNEGATTKVSVRYNGDWTTRIECVDQDGAAAEPWITLNPASGRGNGIDYQWIEIKANRNAGEAREAKLYLIGGGDEQLITVSQADGHFSVSNPVVSGSLKAGEESSASLGVSWDKAFGGEVIVVKASLSGACDGLSIAPETRYTVEAEGNGSLTVPITGTPSSLGEASVEVIFTMDGKELFNGAIAAAVSSSNEIFKESFDKFVWGGHYDTNQKGMCPGGAQAGKEYVGTEAGDGEVSAGTDGAMDAFLTMTEEYRVNRGIEKWTGSKVYEHPGYIKLGTGSAGAMLMTPELSALSSSPEDVAVSIDFLRFDNEDGTYFLTAEGAGEVSGGTIDANLLPAPTKASERKWTTLTFTVKGATNQTRIKLQCEKSEAGYRINVDNFRVMGAAKAVVTEPLATPSVETMSFVPGKSSIVISWDGIKGASSYDIAIAPQDTPDFKKTVNTPNATYTFDELKPGYYIFSVKAICDDNHAFDSEEVTTIVGTAGFAVRKLETPSLFTVKPSVSSAEFSWEAAKSAYGYKVTVLQGEEEVKSEITQNTAYTASNLKPGTSYSVKMKAVVGEEENEYDSDEVSAEFMTLNPDPLAKPSLKLYSASYAYAVVEFQFDAAQQATRKFGIRLYDGDNQIREYNFDFTPKYTAHGTRFIFTALEAGHAYSAQIKRVTTNKDEFVDSEWSDMFQFSTTAAADRTGYLLWNDLDNHPWGGNGPMMAFGIDPKEGDTSFNVITGESAQWNVASPVKNMDNMTKGVGSKIEGGQKYYHETFMPGWSSAQIVADNNDKTKGTGTVYLCAGMMKFGTGSSLGRLDFPAFTSLGGEATLEYTFDASPYVEPNGKTGKFEEAPDAYECEEFEVKIVRGPGVISTADGVSVNAESAVLTNKSAKEMEADKQGFISLTNHKVVVTGATSETVFSINTGHGEKQYRMWLDNMKVKQL